MVAVIPELPDGGMLPSRGSGHRRARPWHRERRSQAVTPMDPFSHQSLMALDISTDGRGCRIDVDLPGVDPSRIVVSVTDRVLSLKAIRRRRPSSEAEITFAERGYGWFSRDLVVSDALDTEHREVRFENGVLTILLPFRAEPGDASPTPA